MMKMNNIKNRKKLSFKNRLKMEFKNSWWFFLFLISFYFFSSTSFKQKNLEIDRLENQVEKLSMTKDKIYDSNQKLQKHIKSQTDIKYIEKTLVKKLGVIPEGHVKVRFKKLDHDLETRAGN